MALFLSGLSGCAPQSVTESRRYLLGISTIKGNKVIKDDELEALIPQKANRRFLGLPIFPYLALYQVGQVAYNREEKQRKLSEITQEYQQKAALYADDLDKLKRIQRKYGKRIEKARRKVEEGNFMMRVLGEAPVYFDENEAARNADKMRNYLFNNGFYNASVNFKTDTIFQRIKVDYHVQENRPTHLRTISYQVRDSNIDSLLQNTKKQAELKPLQRYDGDAFEAERIRIETLLRNNGYYGFSRQYVSFLVNDTISSPDSSHKVVDILVRVNNPPAQPGQSQARHTAYTVESVTFEVLPPAALPDTLFRKDSTTWNGINYIFTGRRFSPRILNSKIRIRPGQLYSQEDERLTQRQLSLMDQFRFVNYGFDSTGNRLHGHFRAIPLDKYQLSADLGLNVIQIQQTPGPFANLSYKIRNVFSGLENFEVNLRGGIEAVTGFSDARLYRSQEFSLSSSLQFPQLLAPIGGIRYQLGKFSPTTQVSAGYNYVNRPEYTRTSVKSALTYSLQPSLTRFYNLSIIDLNIINTSRLNPSFRNLLDTLQLQGNNLINSFRKSFVSDINFSYVYNTNTLLGIPTKAQYLRLAVESGGTTLGIFPGQQKLIQNLFGDLQFFQYIRLNADYRRYWPVNSRASFVARVNTGSVHSYGVSSVPPYEKYFFAGGSNSIRAWLPRRLGPGSTRPRITSSNLSVEAPGELLLEGNLEYRGFLAEFFGNLNYALFIDAGNVWNFPRASSDSPGDFDWRTFTSEIAVGTGFGIRYDFSYFVLRFDFGVKVYDPYLKEFVLDDLNRRRLFDTRQTNFLNLNLGVGYPF
ncbi:translocation and assembly module lipoprotein TamL [Telluribacter humicola]|uniref:translocation and assembly module lipoprotein TamL n=1 Tax=Telluribacter humicola TaxID=1720261 RepID=UPI001A958946|nr:BamA/TamA family outer membrane protein [Telluribacter humicola]